MAEKFTDILTYVISLALAAGVIAFAAYKVVELNGMENPPANMGLNFPPAKRKVIMEGPGIVDPVTTQSLGPVRASSHGPQNADTDAGSLHAYELLSVIDGVAFVAVTSDQEKTLVPVTVGSTLPGGLKVDAISRRGGQWRLVAGNLTLGQIDLPPQ